MANCATEAEEQVAVIEFCDARKIPIFHIPNGGKRGKSEAAYMKLQGVRPGVPDLFLPIAKGGFNGLFIEMKRRKSYRVTKPQQDWIRLLKSNGYMAYVCAGSDAAIELINQYMSIEE